MYTFVRAHAHMSLYKFMCTICVHPKRSEDSRVLRPGVTGSREQPHVLPGWTELCLLRASDGIIFLFIILRVTSRFLYCKFKSLLSNINSSPRFELFDKSFPECTLCVSGLRYSAELGRISSSHSEMLLVLILERYRLSISIYLWMNDLNSETVRTLSCNGWTDAITLG